MADTPPTSAAEWLQFFRPEAEAYVARAQELGLYVDSPSGWASSYASFAAFDAMMKGPKFQTLDFARANEIAERRAGVYFAAVEEGRIAA